MLWSDIEQGNGFFLFATDDDVTAAAYVHGGLYVELAERFQLGIDLRGARGFTDLDAFGQTLEAEYLQLALQLGISW